MNSKRVTVVWQGDQWLVELKPSGKALAFHRRQRDAAHEARVHARELSLPLNIYDRHGNVRETADYSNKARKRRTRTGTGRPVTVAGRRGTTLA